MKTLYNLLLLFILFSNIVSSQEIDKMQYKLSLKQEIIKMDSLLFDVAFNQCDLVLYKKIMSPNLEFYDDRSGLTSSFETEIASFKDRCSRPFSVTRKLVSSTVHVLGDYGAVQIGVHEFYENDKKVERGKFISIWEKQKDNSWILKRAISYDHEPVSDESKVANVNADKIKAKVSLEHEILKMDSLFFNAAFNQCDLELYKKIMSPNLEFYDDRSGLNTSFETEIASFNDRCSRPFSVTRKIVSSTVHVLGDYGALQIGTHEFYENDKKVQSAKFVIIWERQKDKSWILKRTISYDHEPTTNGPKLSVKKEIFKTHYKKTLDIVVPKLMAEYLAPAVGVGIIKDGKIELVKVYGENQKGHKAPKNTIFNIASITKPVVTAAILKLVAQGDWDLDEPLFHYWTDPDVMDDKYAKLITTRHCLSHTTGFKNWRRFEKDGKLKFNFKPGTKFQYSGEGMEYLRHAVESKFKIGLEKIVDSLVFKPLGMKDATMGWLQEKDTARFAKWYDTRGNLHPINYKTKDINAADDMLLTVKDLLLFGNAIMHKKVVDGALYDEMIKPQSAINDKLNQGLGWVVYDKLSNGEYILNHDGGDPGVITTLILFPKSKNGIVIFVNSDNGASITNNIVKAIVKNGMEVIEGLHWDTKIPKSIKLEDIALKKYAGTYKTDHDFSINFHIENGFLYTDSSVFPKVKLYPMAKDEFYVLPFELYFKFIEVNNEMKLQFLSSKKVIELEGEKL